MSGTFLEEPPAGMPVGTPASAVTQQTEENPPAGDAGVPAPVDLTQPLTEEALGYAPPPPPEEQERQQNGILRDLQSERAQRQSLQQQLAETQRLLAQTAQRPGGVQAIQDAISGQQPAPAGPNQQEIAEWRQYLHETAIDLALYNDAGQPDLHKAARIVERQHRLTERAVAKAVGQLEPEIAQLKSVPLMQQTFDYADSLGVDRGTLQAAISAMPPHTRNDQMALQAAVLTVLGLQVQAAMEGRAAMPVGRRQRVGQQPQQGQQPGPQPGIQRDAQGRFVPAGPQPAVQGRTPPIYSEPAGGRPNAPRTAQLDPFFRDRLQNAGMKSEGIDTFLSRYTPGMPTRLE